MIDTTQPRIHDLPVMWDGDPIQWSGWQMEPPALVCSPRYARRACCPDCGSTAERPMNRGVVRGATHTPAGLRNIHGGKLLLNLFAFRCPDCRHDQVQDLDGRLWDLDDTDYGDEGSWGE